jgi:hypothetical protein
MPKKEMDYSKMVIYKICCKDLNITDIYIGHTCNLIQRRYDHKCKCNKETSKEYSFKVYNFIRNNGGWENWEVIEIEKCPCLDFEEAKKIERYYIETFNASLNSFIPSRTQKEFYENNKEYLATYKREWYEKHKEKVLEQKKEHREKNKEKIKEYKNEKIECFSCGAFISRCNMLRHKKSFNHF